jgi:hypothetical protein
VFPWVGTKRLDTVAVALMANTFDVAAEHHRFEVENCAAQGTDRRLGREAALEPKWVSDWKRRGREGLPAYLLGS